MLRVAILVLLLTSETLALFAYSDNSQAVSLSKIKTVAVAPISTEAIIKTRDGQHSMDEVISPLRDAAIHELKSALEESGLRVKLGSISKNDLGSDMKADFNIQDDLYQSIMTTSRANDSKTSDTWITVPPASACDLFLYVQASGVIISENANLAEAIQSGVISGIAYLFSGAMAPPPLSINETLVMVDIFAYDGSSGRMLWRNSAKIAGRSVTPHTMREVVRQAVGNYVQNWARQESGKKDIALGPNPDAILSSETLKVKDIGLAESRKFQFGIDSNLKDDALIFPASASRIVWHANVDEGLFNSLGNYRIRWMNPKNELYHEEDFYYDFGSSHLQRGISLQRDDIEKIGRWKVRVTREGRLIDERFFIIRDPEPEFKRKRSEILKGGI